jgi:light-regulated signal transduction histidine kinase (bacteriophytochrome)
MAMRTTSIATRLTIMNMLVSGVALLLACAGFFAYDQVTFRQNMLRTLSAQAQIVASNSISALDFNDSRSASNTLLAFKNSPHITSAGILTLDYRPFAQYMRAPGDEVLSIPALHSGELEASRFGSTHVVLVRQILSESKPIGFVYIRADLHELDQRLRRYALIAFGVLIISLLAAMAISSTFRKSVAQPIIQLAETAQAVSRNQDYSVRVTPPREQNELAVLIDSFNKMLQEIQQRDTELQKAHGELELRVAERTRDLESSNRELEAFSYSVSHDLRAPLDTMSGFSYVLLKNYGDKLDENGKQSLQSIRAAARRMAELLDDLLNLSRITTSTMRREEVDLSAAARSIMEELCRTAPDRKVDYVAPVKMVTNADARLLQIVLENLLRNAWKYTSRHERARIEFGQEMKDGRVVYFVKDDGSGFDPRSADRLFQPFQRLHSSAEFPGNGIGLATVRRIIQRHGGQVWAEGAIEHGAAFYFTLQPHRSDSSTQPVARS